MDDEWFEETANSAPGSNQISFGLEGRQAGSTDGLPETRTRLNYPNSTEGKAVRPLYDQMSH